MKQKKMLINKICENVLKIQLGRLHCLLAKSNKKCLT